MSPSEKLDALEFDVVRAIIYHDHRRAFFDVISKFAKLLILCGSSATLSAAVNLFGEDYLKWFAAFTAFISITDLVFSPGGKYTEHTDIKNRFSRLRSQIAAKESPSNADFVAIKLVFDEIEQSEPPIKRVLNCISYNEAIDATGRDGERKVLIGRAQKMVAPFIDLFPDSIKQA